MAEVREHPQLGRVLRSLRERVRLTQRGLADAVNRSRRPGEKQLKADWVAKLETRPSARPSERDLDDILRALGSGRDELDELLLTSDPARPVEEPAPAWSANVLPDTRPRSRSAALYATSSPLRSLGGGSLMASHSSLAPDEADESELLAFEDEDMLVAAAAPSPVQEVDRLRGELLENYDALEAPERRRAVAFVRSLRR